MILKPLLTASIVFSTFCCSAARADEQVPPVSMSVMDDTGFVPSVPSVAGKGRSYSRPLPSWPGVADTTMGVWKAGPGEYRKPGVKEIETFVVMEGRGKIAIEGFGEKALYPGIVITIPPGAAAALTVTKHLRKFSIVQTRR